MNGIESTLQARSYIQGMQQEIYRASAETLNQLV
jgi:hypothetical protein